MAYTTINKSTEHFNTVTYTGDGTSSRDITGVNFQPDWTWIKQRNGTFSHVLGNVLSGDNKFLSSNGTGAEGTDSTKFRTFVSDGIQVGNHNSVNGGSNTYVAWNWKANGSGSANTDGDIASTVSVNTTSGFSIVSYTGNGTSGATVGHGLGVAPTMIIEKGRSVTDDWLIYHKSLGATYGLALNNTNASAASTGYWNDTAPTSSLFTIGNNGKVNTNGGTHIAYCFAEKTGYSKFGSYIGNGNADGTFVYTGFKPAFVIGKRTNAAEDWYLFDGTRDDTNPCNKLLYPGGSNAEYTLADRMDFLSNGFKQYNNDLKFNGSGDTYIYMAFAEAPLVGTNYIPCTAR